MPQKKSVWLSYAWEDNEGKDVDFLAQELEKSGLEVKLDRWNLTAGKRLWEQIEYFIDNPSESDAWILYATQASLGSQACKEEYAYALNRALENRGEDFPVIALFPAPVDSNLIPAGIKTRLYVSLTDPEWKERIFAAVEKRQPDIHKYKIEEYKLETHKLAKEYGDKKFAIEVRPRAGTWSPFIVGIPIGEKDRVSPFVSYGPKNHINVNRALFNTGEAVSFDGGFWSIYADNEATPTQSYYIFCKELPSVLIFGIKGGKPQYKVELQSI